MLALIAQRAPEPVRAAFLAGLRAQGVAEPADPAASPALPRAWSRPDLYAAVFASEVLLTLDVPERAAATVAITTLSVPAAGRRGCPRPESEATQP